MARHRNSAQQDLFAPHADAPGFDLDDEEFVDAEFIQRIRDEVTATLAKAKGAARLPWRDLTQTMVTEMRFHSIAQTWLPAEESARLREEFAAEMLRLYAVHDRELDEQE